MRFRFDLLTLVELASLVGFLGLVTALVVQRDDRQLIPLDATALAVGPGDERWYGVFFQDQHVGFTVTRTSPTADGGTLHETRSSFRVATFGKLQEVITAGSALTDAGAALQRFDFFMASGDVRLSARGEVRGRQVVMEVTQGGETSELSFDVARPPQVSQSLESLLRKQELAVGMRLEVPYFDPLTLADGEMQISVDSVEVLEGGEEAYWLTTEFAGMEARALVTPAGDTLRQESAMGMSSVLMTREAAQDVPTSGEPADLISLSAVHLQGDLPQARQARHLELRILGVEPERVRHQPPLQTVTGDVVVVDVPLLAELPPLPIADRSEPAWLEATLTLPAAHPDILTRSAEVVGDAKTRLDAVQRLTTWVYDYVEKVPSIGVPNGLEVLRTARGDCNEHTALFVSLARAAGIPTRIAAGVVYSDRIGPTGAFYYHAWPEVRLGGEADWVPVDPTFGQVPADATHVKLVEGDLDRQVEIMAVMGRLGFELQGVRK